MSGATAEVRRGLLPDHPWLGLPDLRERRLVAPGADWLALRDLVVEPVDALPRHPVRLRLRGLAERGHEWPASRLIPAGTRLTVKEIFGWDDRWFPSVAVFIDFTLPDGRAFHLITRDDHLERVDDRGVEVWEDGIDWADLACAAAIVPVGHPYAADSAALDSALARIDAALTGSKPRTLPLRPQRRRSTGRESCGRPERSGRVG